MKYPFDRLIGPNGEWIDYTVLDVELTEQEQTVSVTYSAKKTNVAALQAAMKKIGYDTRIVSDKAKEKPAKGKRK